jgi:hypothetical protein
MVKEQDGCRYRRKALNPHCVSVRDPRWCTGVRPDVAYPSVLTRRIVAVGPPGSSESDEDIEAIAMMRRWMEGDDL